MSIREALAEKRKLALAAAIALVVFAISLIIYQNAPEKRAKLGLAYFSSDDGKTWFTDSSFRVPPFDHNGKPASIAVIYNYAKGSKEFCAYLVQYTPEARQQLEHALADAQSKGQPPTSVALFRDRAFMSKALLYKSPGPNNPWIPGSDPRAIQVQTVTSPDGSEIDQVFVY